MPVILDHDHGSKSRREHLLAVWAVRRNLERRSTGGQTERRPSMAMNAGELARELEELIEALDRRMPRVEQAGEAAIARDAAALRAKAFDRLAELSTNPTLGLKRDSGDPI
jgi:hypothetical protein